MKTLFEGKKLYAVIIAFLLIITFFITFHIIRNHYQYVVKGTIATNTLTANLFSSLVYEHQKATIGILESYAQRPLFIDAVKVKDFNNVIPHLQSLSKNHTEIDALFITDQYGTLWANYPVDSKGFGKNLAYRDWYKGVSKNWKPYISSVYRLIVLEKGLAVAVSVPVLDRKGKVIGILSSAHRTFFLATFIKGNIIDPEKNTTLLDQEGNIIFSNAVPYQEKITKYPDAHVLEKALAGVFIDMEIADAKEKGIISYVSIAPVRGIGWSVIVGQEKNAILKPLYGYFIRSAATGFVIFLFLTVCLLYFRREYRYRKTKELLQAEEKYRNIFNDAILGIYQTTSEGRFLSANPALARMYGYDTPEELINNVTDLATQSYINPEDREIFKRILLREGVVEKFETPVRKKGGETIWVSINAHTVKDTQGNISSFEGTIENITERKRAEAELRESKEFTESLIASMQDGVSVLDSDGVHIDVNAAFCQMTGFSREELIGVGLPHPYWPPEAYEEIEKGFQKTLRGEFSDIELTFMRKNGERFPVIVSPSWVKDKQGNVTSYFATVKDITERKRAEEKLKDSEERYKKLFEDDLTGDFFATQEGTILDCNPSFLKMFGFGGKEEPLNTNFLDLYRSREEKEAFINQLREKKKLEFHECVLLKRDGTLINVMENIVGHFDEQGNLKQFKGYLFDITERKRAEAERERLMVDLEAKNKEMEAFVYTISHDLKAPLVSLNGFSGALQKEYESQLGEGGRHYLERIQANVAHMEALITSLLELSRIGQVVGAIEKIDVAVLLRKIQDELAVRLKEAGTEFVVQEPLPTVRADRGRIHQVFANLIDNAVKFRSAERALRIEVGCQEESGFYRFHVADNGIGIAPQYHEQIFTPFRKLHPEIEGMGIGLALVKKIVEHHGGRAWVESEAGKGSTFYFTIPVTNDQ